MKKFKKWMNLKNCIIIVICLLFFISILINIKQFNDRKNLIEADENIVFFGDSLFEQYKVEEFFWNKHVVNSGISGNKTEDLLNRINEGVYSYNPTKVHILIGVNDLNHQIEHNEILNNIELIIKKIKKVRKNATIYVHSLYPINEKIINESNSTFKNNIDKNMINTLNKKIIILCEKNKVTYINVHKSLINKNGELKNVYTKDGVHLNDLGYYRVTNAIEKYL